MPLIYKDSDLQTKKDIIEAVISCLKVAFKYQGYVYGSFVRYALVAVYDSRMSSLTKMFKGKEEEINIKLLNLWFPTTSDVQSFVQEMGSSFNELPNDNTERKFYLMKLGTSVTTVVCKTKEQIFKPYLHFNVNALGFSQCGWKCLTDDVDYSSLFETIKKKCVSLTADYILELYGSKNYDEDYIMIQNDYCSEGWEITIGTFTIVTLERQYFDKAIKYTGASLLKDKIDAIHRIFHSLDNKDKAEVAKLFKRCMWHLKDAKGYFKTRSICKQSWTDNRISSPKLKVYFDNTEDLEKYKVTMKDVFDTHGILCNKMGHVVCKIDDPEKYKFNIDQLHGYMVEETSMFIYKELYKIALRSDYDNLTVTIMPKYKELLLKDDDAVAKLNEKFSGWSIKLNDHYKLPIKCETLRMLLTDNKVELSAAITSLNIIANELGKLREVLMKLNK